MRLGNPDGRFELVSVDAVKRDVEQVAPRHRPQRWWVPIRGKRERSAEMRDDALQTVGGVRRQAVPPDTVDEHIGTHGPAGLQQQRDQHRARVAATQRHSHPLAAHFERSEESELQQRPA